MGSTDPANRSDGENLLEWVQRPKSIKKDLGDAGETFKKLTRYHIFADQTTTTEKDKFK